MVILHISPEVRVPLFNNLSYVYQIKQTTITTGLIGDMCSNDETCHNIAHAYCDKEQGVCVCKQNYLLPHDNSYCIERW